MKMIENKTSTRSLTVYDHYSPRKYNNNYPVPYLRLRGKWLEEAGFYIGQRVKVVVTYGALLIISDEED